MSGTGTGRAAPRRAAAIERRQVKKRLKCFYSAIQLEITASLRWYRIQWAAPVPFKYLIPHVISRSLLLEDSSRGSI